MPRKNSEIITDINEAKAKLDALYKERDENIMILHSHGVAINQIARQLDMKRQNVSALIMKLSASHK